MLVVEIQHYSWLNRDGNWYPVAQYEDTEEGRKAATADALKFAREYSFQPVDPNRKPFGPREDRPCRIREE